MQNKNRSKYQLERII